MERDTYVQEWLQADIEAVVRGAGFEITGSRPFERTGGATHCLASLGVSPTAIADPITLVSSQSPQAGFWEIHGGFLEADLWPATTSEFPINR